MKKLLIYLFLAIPLASFCQDTIKNKWYKPDYLISQFAGEIGFISLGAGKYLNNSKNLELDIMLGHLEEEFGGDYITTAALKFNYVPWKVTLAEKLTYLPLTTGLLLYHPFGKDFNKFNNTDLYPKGYYWWAIDFRFGPIIGGRLNHELKSKVFSNFQFYYEFVTNDLYIYSWATNTGLIPLRRIFNFSFGIKMTLH